MPNKRACPGTMVPVEALLHIYNLLIIIYVCVFFSQIRSSPALLTLHIAAAAAYLVFQYFRNRRNHRLLQIGTVWIPIVLLSALHYETGLFNRVIFHDFMDSLVINLDRTVFGFDPYLLLRHKFSSELLAQLSHAAYASFYVLLIAPVTLLYLHERKAISAQETPLVFWSRASRLKEMQFVLMFTMLSCYIIFIIFPVKGPTHNHSALFPEPRGMVALMNYLFTSADLDGGAMPSSHVAGALVVVIYTFRYLRRWFWLALGLFVPLTVSTVYNSYHYATDVIAGLISGWAFYLAGRVAYRRIDQFHEGTGRAPQGAVKKG